MHEDCRRLRLDCRQDRRLKHSKQFHILDPSRRLQQRQYLPRTLHQYERPELFPIYFDLVRARPCSLAPPNLHDPLRIQCTASWYLV